MAKKIKKEIKKPDVKDLLSFIESDKEDERNEPKKVVSKTKKRPSQKGQFRRFLKKENAEDWTAVDFIGLYLDLYIKVTGEEDLDFVGKRNDYKYGKEKAYINKCLEKMFNNHKKGFKQYIEWIMEWWMTDESFVDDYPSFWAVFTDKKATFVKKFKASRIKKKVVRKRKDIDNEYASKSAWDQYFEEADK